MEALCRNDKIEALCRDETMEALCQNDKLGLVIATAMEGSPAIDSKLLGLCTSPAAGNVQPHLFGQLMGGFLQQLWVITQPDDKVAQLRVGLIRDLRTARHNPHIVAAIAANHRVLVIII